MNPWDIAVSLKCIQFHKLSQNFTMTLFMNKGSSYSYKRTTGVILVSMQTLCLRGKAACHTVKRCFSESSSKSNYLSEVRKYLSEVSNKWNGKMLFNLLLRLLKTIRNCFFMLLNWYLKIIRICLFAPFRWVFRKIRNILLSIRRMFRYRIPLVYIVLVNFFSIATGMYAMGMSIISYDEKLKAESEADNLIKLYPQLQDINYFEVSHNQYMDIFHSGPSPFTVLAALIAIYLYIRE